MMKVTIMMLVDIRVPVIFHIFTPAYILTSVGNDLVNLTYK